MAIVGFDRPENDLASEASASSWDGAFPLPQSRSRQVRRCRRRVGLPAEPQAAVGARHAVNFACALWSAAELYETAASCVTELVTNAVQHAAWPQDPSDRLVWLTLSLAGPYFLVEVADPDPQLPFMGARVDWDRFDWSATVADDGRGESGFGLAMVVNLVREARGEFGVVLTATDKTVFFALPLGNWLPENATGAVNMPARRTAEV